MNSVNPWARKSAALAILGAILLAIYLATIGPMLNDAAMRRDELDQLRGLGERYAKAAHEIPTLERKLTSLRREDDGDGVLGETNETLAAAALQSRLKASVVDAGGQLQSVEVLTGEHVGKRQKIGVRARIAIALAGLQRVMAALNETHPALFV
jgi:hypothetical protein